MDYDKFLQLKSVKNIGGYRQNFTHTKVGEIITSGCTSFEKYGRFQPNELYDDVMAACKELGLKISQYLKEWNVVGGGHGCTVFIALTDAIDSSWCSHNLYKPIEL